MQDRIERRRLRQLARMYGVMPSYLDVWNRRRWPSDESLVKTLALLGAGLRRIGDVADALRARRQECWQTIAEPVATAWEGHDAALHLRLPAALAGRTYRCRVVFERGGDRQLEGRLDSLPVVGQRTCEGARYVVVRLPLPGGMPQGYHRCEVELGDRRVELLVISAPERSSSGPPRKREMLWGVFLPLYALYRNTSWGAGDFGDLESLMEWTADRGGSMVATLPLLSSLWELDADPSPYSPATRLAFNEFYLDLRRVPELQQCPAAREMLASVDEAVAGRGPAAGGFVDYASQAALKRRILALLSESFFASEKSSPRRDQFERFRVEKPELDLYARFRAVGERLGKPWSEWPEPLRSGTIGPTDYDLGVYEVHAYGQWQVEEQLRAMADNARRREMLWYLDFPLGVSGSGYDAWREPDVFVQGAAGGAPPDAFFTKGQNWGFPPMNPLALRRQGYRYLITALRRHLEYARVLRFDHVMALYRLYWIPHGLPAHDGAYVRYPAEELFAILTLESHRYQSRIVGENLGTVPPALNRMMERHGLDEMYVVQYEANAERSPVLRPVPDRAVASLNTHDMPQYAGWWTGLDVDERVDLGLLAEDEASAERDRRAMLRQKAIAMLRQRGLLDGHPTRDLQRTLEAFLAHLGSSRAPLVLVNLEDLWQETDPQNTPGTFRERPNWRRRARYSFEEFIALPGVRRLLETVDRSRREAEQATRERDTKADTST